MKVSTSPAATGPELPDAADEGAGPFDRAILLTQNLVQLKMDPTQLSNRLHIHAKQWDTSFNFGPDPALREYSLGKVIEETKAFVRDVRGTAGDMTNMLTDPYQQHMPSEARAGLKQRAAALNAIGDELDARLVDMQRDMKKPAPHPDGR